MDNSYLPKNGSIAFKNARAEERDKQIFLTSLKNNLRKNNTLAIEGISNKDTSKLPPIKIEVIEDDRENEESPCQHCALMSGNRSFVEAHKLDNHRAGLTQLKSYKCSDCDYKSFNKSGVVIHIDCVHDGEGVRVLSTGCLLCEEGEVHFMCEVKLEDQAPVLTNPETISPKNLGHRESLEQECEKVKEFDNTQESINKEFQRFLNIDDRSIKTETTALKRQIVFRCNKCDIEFKSNTNLMLHKRVVHDLEYRFQCGECGRKSFQRSQIARHIEKCHNRKNVEIIEKSGFRVEEEKASKEDKLKDTDAKKRTKVKEATNMKCPECDYITQNKQRFEKHVELNHGPKAILKGNIVKCNLCEYETRRMNNCIIHKRVVHEKEVRYQCSQCDEKNFFRKGMERHFEKEHLKTESPAGPKYFKIEFSCQHCDKRFSDKRLLKKHTFLIHSDKQIKKEDILKCPDCDYETHRPVNLAMHKRIHGKERKWRSCKVCGYKTFVRSRLLRHTQTMHAENAEEINGFTQNATSNLFQCNNCNYETTTAFYIRRHKFIAHNSNIDPSEIIKCDNCEFQTLKKVNMRIHNRQRHKDKHEKQKSSESTQINCKFCDFRNGMRALVAHMKSMHPQEALFECDVCSYKSNYLPNLNTHKNAKHAKESLQCDKCEFKTSWKNSFLDHMRVKHGIFKKNTKYKKDLEFSEIICDHCGFKATSKMSMKMHTESQCQMKEDYRPSRTMNSYRQNYTRPRKCRKCDYKSKNSKYIRRHFSISHGSNHSPPDEILKCEYCEYESLKMSSIRNHVLKRHKEHQKKLSVKKSKSKVDENKLSCESCDYKTLNNLFLERHKKLNHSRNSVATHDIWKCKFCEYETNKRSNMIFHRRKRHSNEAWAISDVKNKEFTCTICNFKTSKMIIMRKHEEFNHSETSANKLVLKCNKCDYETINPKNMQYHERKSQCITNGC